MNLTSITAAIRAIGEAIKGIVTLIGGLVGLAKEQDQKRNEAQALERRDEKVSRINDFVADANRVPPDGQRDARTPEQR